MLPLGAWKELNDPACPHNRPVALVAAHVLNVAGAKPETPLVPKGRFT